MHIRKATPGSFKKGCLGYWKGKKRPPFSKEWKENLIKASNNKKGEKSSSWKGGRRINTKGYMRIHSPLHSFCDCDGYVLEHRLVVESQIERYLTPEEVVHHRGKRDDNHPRMLIAFINDIVHHKFHKNPHNVKPEDIIFDGRKLISFQCK